MVRDMTGKNPMYYEAILQLRDVSQEIINFAENDIKIRKIYLTKKVKVKNGWDYYLADSDLTKALGKKLQEQFGGEYVVTATLVGRKESRGIYRMTILFRGISFRKGDVVEYKGEKYNIIFVGKDILMQEVETGKKIHVRYKEIGMVRKVSS